MTIHQINDLFALLIKNAANAVERQAHENLRDAMIRDYILRLVKKEKLLKSKNHHQKRVTHLLNEIERFSTIRHNAQTVNDHVTAQRKINSLRVMLSTARELVRIAKTHLESLK
jgi:hypothetical protein